jgi:hypothetical protein
VGTLQVGTNANEALCLLNTGTSAISVTGVTVTGTDFSPSAGTVLPLVVQPNAASPLVAGFNFAPTCSNLPPGASCTFSPASELLQAFNESVNFNLAVSTTARPAASLRNPDLKLWYSLAAMFAFIVGASLRPFSRIGLVSCLMLLGFVVSCGGGSSKVPSVPTPAGTFQITVNGTSNGVTHSKNLVLVVN